MHEVDGLRGWAALIVVLFHMVYETFGVLYPQFRSAIPAMLSGRFAVALFFVLSGEALSSTFVSTERLRSLAGLALRRLPRLSIPVFFSALLAYLLTRSGLSFRAPAAVIVHRVDWLGSSGTSISSLRHLVTFPFVGMYQGPIVDSLTNPFAWTMGVEFVGSFVVFAVLPLLTSVRYPRTVLVLFSIIFAFGSVTMFISDFLIGICFAMLRRDDTISNAADKNWVRLVSPIVAVSMMFAASYSLRNNILWLDAVIAPIFVISIFCSRDLSVFFSNGVSRFLGKISFSIYLIQWPVLISLTSYWIVSVGAANMTPNTALLIAFGSTSFCIVAAFAFEPVEIFTRWVGRQLTNHFIIPSQPTG